MNSVCIWPLGHSVYDTEPGEVGITYEQMHAIIENVLVESGYYDMSPHTRTYSLPRSGPQLANADPFGLQSLSPSWCLWEGGGLTRTCVQNDTCAETGSETRKPICLLSGSLWRSLDQKVKSPEVMINMWLFRPSLNLYSCRMCRQRQNAKVFVDLFFLCWHVLKLSCNAVHSSPLCHENRLCLHCLCLHCIRCMHHIVSITMTGIHSWVCTDNERE